MSKWSRDGFVYVIGDSDQRIVKIGWSIRPEERLPYIQTGAPFKLTLHWSTEAVYMLEILLHRRFDSQRMHGEWFEFPDGDAVAQVKAAAEELRAASVLRTRRADGTPRPPHNAEIAWEAVQQHLFDEGVQSISAIIDGRMRLIRTRAGAPSNPAA